MHRSGQNLYYRLPFGKFDLRVQISAVGITSRTTKGILLSISEHLALYSEAISNELFSNSWVLDYFVTGPDTGML